MATGCAQPPVSTALRAPGMTSADAERGLRHIDRTRNRGHSSEMYTHIYLGRRDGSLYHRPCLRAEIEGGRRWRGGSRARPVVAAVTGRPDPRAERGPAGRGA